MSNLDLKNEHGITVAKRRTSEQLLQDDGPYTRLLFDLVKQAKESRASDIHIEPNELGVDLRMRVNGEIYLSKRVTVSHRESLLLEAKRVFGLSIGVSGRPQDGRVSLPSLRLDLRVSLLPTHFGEKIVMRLLDLEASFDLKKLGFKVDELKMLRNATRLEDGVVIVSGPTGSGKSRTLYSLLQAINPKACNIITLEDPIEYRIEGLNQVQVSKKMGFADALRAVLRQDPDVILVGEIRDAETAKLCFQAAETGHLVFSTLHANGALEAVERLSNLGVDRLTLESNLRLSIAQRLEQKLCPFCSTNISEDLVLTHFRDELDELVPVEKKFNVRRRSQEIGGCQFCRSGIAGRVPILEWASMEKEEDEKKPRLELVQSLEDARLLRMFEGEIHCEEIGDDEIDYDDEIRGRDRSVYRT